MNESGRQESNLPSTAYQTVASPLGFGPKSALYGAFSTMSGRDRTRTCVDCLFVGEVPSPLGHEGSIQSGKPESNRPGGFMRPRWNRLRSIPQSFGPVGPAGVEPAFHCVSDGCLAARLRPETSALYGNRTRLTC